MNELSQKNEFENRFTENVIEIAAVTGPLGVGASKGPLVPLWDASINLIAWKDLNSDKSIKEEELPLELLVDDAVLEKYRDILKENTVVRLQVRKGKYSMMFVKILETDYKDDELEKILQESMKPVFYNDKILGEFELDKGIKSFSKKICWAKEEGYLYFDLDTDENVMKSALETAHELFTKQDEWNMKIRTYASDELLELANEWLQDDDEADIDEITKEMFINLMKLDSISVEPEGEFEIFFFDGDMFWGHSIVVNGNINGEFTSTEIAG